ncbi:thiol:disulfide interchange protein DsbG [Salinisphaera sp.]|uniref:thiol:disulfide interchange protein DsbG n=1 Tax=Salinisphaera sp. TaxID=1914330 RepID=UPI002D797D93|nr:thiol:disulfide interchange protein DsbG [Salinisphaera sp.]HET7313190.1 thiol:disulfide interchange protein DsbG [Salinisphaera sp.]
MKVLLPALLACLVAVSFTTAGAADKNDTPAPIKALKKQGLTLHGTFAAPAGMTGYAASYRGHPIAIYLLPGGRKALVGSLIDGQGRDLSAEPLQRLVVGPSRQKAWAKLKKATWVADGSDQAERVIYMFTDPNCPYCHRFWQAARPWVKAGKIQIRHVLVGLLKPSSLPKAAAILAADDPSAALDRSERHYDDGGITPLNDPPAGLAKKIKQNTDLMKSLGLFATPTLFYRDADGDIAIKQGLPRGDALTDVMGSPRP